MPQQVVAMQGEKQAIIKAINGKQKKNKKKNTM